MSSLLQSSNQPLQSTLMLSFAPLNTLSVREGLNDLENETLFLQELKKNPIRLGPLDYDPSIRSGGKTLVGNPPGLQRIKYNHWQGPCQYSGEYYWMYQIKGYLEDDYMKLEAVKPVKSCLSYDDMDENSNSF